MIIALRSRANGQFVCADSAGDAPLIANRAAVGAWEMFDVFEVVDGHLVPLESMPTPPLPPTPPTPPGPLLPPREQFLAWVAGKPFGQQTLLDLEPTLLAHGWHLEKPNANREVTKLYIPNGQVFRVGFGEGTWVWLLEYTPPGV